MFLYFHTKTTVLQIVFFIVWITCAPIKREFLDNSALKCVDKVDGNLSTAYFILFEEWSKLRSQNKVFIKLLKYPSWHAQVTNLDWKNNKSSYCRIPHATSAN